MCDKNCFQCSFDDCIRDERQDEAERIVEYRQNHSDRVRATRRKQYVKNREQEIEYQRNYYKNLKTSEKYAEYRKKRNEYSREYRARKKAEKVS